MKRKKKTYDFSPQLPDCKWISDPAKEVWKSPAFWEDHTGPLPWDMKHKKRGACVDSPAVVLAQHPQNKPAEWKEHTSQRLQALALWCVPLILNFVASAAGAAMHSAQGVAKIEWENMQSN